MSKLFNEFALGDTTLKKPYCHGAADPLTRTT